MSVAGSTLVVLLFWSLLACSHAGDAAYGRGMDLYRAKHYAEAAIELEQAANAGHVHGMGMIATMLLKGQEVAREVLSQSLFLMNLESCRSLNLWCPVFRFCSKNQTLRQNHFY